MRGQPALPVCCGRCGGPDAAARTARRHFYMSAVLGAATPGEQPPPRAVTGMLEDTSRDGTLVIGTAAGERRLRLAEGASAWRDGPAEPASLRAGDHVVARLAAGQPGLAAKVWAGIGRVTGTIAAAEPDRLLVDVGATVPPQPVVISARASALIRVRFPQLGPGRLIDVIGARRRDALEALLPATAQPATFAGRAEPSSGGGPAGGGLSGSATWHEPAGPGEQVRGAAYPAVDPAGGCAEPAATAGACPGLPLLAVGTRLMVRNDCAQIVGELPITSCGAMARLFHDRCLTCGTSPRGRVVDLTLTSFVELGGDPERGCFNATIRAGAAR